MNNLIAMPSEMTMGTMQNCDILGKSKGRIINTITELQKYPDELVVKVERDVAHYPHS